MTSRLIVDVLQTCPARFFIELNHVVDIAGNTTWEGKSNLRPTDRQPFCFGVHFTDI